MVTNRRANRRRRKALGRSAILAGLLVGIAVLGTVKVVDLVASSASFAEAQFTDADRTVAFGLSPSSTQLQDFQLVGATLGFCPGADGSTIVNIVLNAVSATQQPPPKGSLLVLAPADAHRVRQYLAVGFVENATGDRTSVFDEYEDQPPPLAADPFGRWSLVELPLSQRVVTGPFVPDDSTEAVYGTTWGVSFQTNAFRYKRSGVGSWNFRFVYDPGLSRADMDTSFEQLSPADDDGVVLVLCERAGTTIEEVLPEDTRTRPYQVLLDRPFERFEIEAIVKGGRVRALADLALPGLVVLVPMLVGVWFLEIEGWSGRRWNPVAGARGRFRRLAGRYRRYLERRRARRATLRERDDESEEPSAAED